MFIVSMHTYLIEALKLRRQTIHMLIDENMQSEDDLLHHAISTQKQRVVIAIYFFKLSAAFWRRDFASSMDFAKKYESIASRLHKSYESIETKFYLGLMSFEFVREESDQRWLGDGDSAIVTFRKWASHSAWNYQHKLLLLEAERHFALGEPSEAERKYKLAIESAHDHRFQQDEGLAFKLFGYFHVHFGKYALALQNLSNSQQCYQAWGCAVKVEYLDAFISSLIEQTKAAVRA